jgi:hypothetical protein
MLGYKMAEKTGDFDTDFNTFFFEYFGKEINRDCEEEMLEIGRCIKAYTYSAVRQEQTKIQLNLTSFPTPQIPTLTEFEAPMMFINDGKAYLLKAEAVDMPLKGFENKIYKGYEDLMKKEIHILQEKYNERLKNIRKDVEKMKNELFTVAISTLGIAEELGWVYRNGKFYLPKKIEAHNIRYDHSIYYIKETPFYVNNSSIPAKGEIHSTYVEDSFHPNVEGNKVCLGRLGGSPFTQFVGAFESFIKLVNLNSAYDGRAKERARNIIRNREYQRKVDGLMTTTPED